MLKLGRVFPYRLSDQLGDDFIKEDTNVLENLLVSPDALLNKFWKFLQNKLSDSPNVFRIQFLFMKKRNLKRTAVLLNESVEIEGRERVWTPNFSFKKPIECGLLWSKPWCFVSNVQTQFSVSVLMRAVCLYLKISINLHENSKSNMLF